MLRALGLGKHTIMRKNEVSKEDGAAIQGYIELRLAALIDDEWFPAMKSDYSIRAIAEAIGAQPEAIQRSGPSAAHAQRIADAFRVRYLRFCQVFEKKVNSKYEVR